MFKFRFSPFARLLASETLNTTSSSVLLIATPLIAITVLDANALEIGILAAAGTAAPLLFGLSAGAIADRLDRRSLLLWCGVLRLVLVATLTLLVYSGHLSMAILCIVSFGISAVKTLFDSVVAAVVPTIVRRGALVKANSWYEAVNSTAYTLGPAIAGWLLQTVSVVAVYTVNLGLYLASTLFLKGIDLPSAPRNVDSNQSHLSDIAEGIRLLWRNEVQRTIAMAAGFFNLFHTAFLTVFTVFAVKELGFSPASFGTVVSMVGLAGLFGALCAPKVISVLGVRQALTGSLLIIGPIGVPILFAEHFSFLTQVALIAGCLAAWDFLIVVHVIVEQTVRQAMVDNRQLSRITATTRFVSWGADPIGALLGGLAATTVIGSRGALLICQLGFTFSGALLLTSRGIRGLSAMDFRSTDGQAISD